MSRHLVRYLGRKSAAHPKAVLFVVGVLTLIAALTARHRLEVELDVAALLPASSQVAVEAARAWSDFGGYDFMLCVLEVKPSAPREVREQPGEFLKGIAPMVRTALDDKRFFNQVTHELTRSDLGLSGNDAALMSLLTEQELARIEERLGENGVARALRTAAAAWAADPTTATLNTLAADPLGFDAIVRSTSQVVRGPLKFAARDGYFLSEDGEMLLLLMWPGEPFTKIDVGRRINQFLEATRRGLYIRNPEWRNSVEIKFTGPHIEAAEGAEAVRHNLAETSLVSLFTVLLLFFLAFRQPEALLFVAIPLVVGVLWALGLASLFVPRITQITLSFTAILVGLGIDFSIHLYNRYLEDFRGGSTTMKALDTALTHTGPTIVAGASTTAIAFLAMALMRFQGFKELGIFGGIGIVTCLMAVTVTLPALMVLMLSKDRRRTTPLASFGLKKIAFTALNYPHATVVSGLCIAAWLGLNAVNARFDDDFRNLHQPSDQYNQLLERIDAHFSTPSNQVLLILERESLDEAIRDNDRLHENIEASRRRHGVQSVDSLRTICPSPVSQLASLQRVEGMLGADLEGRFRAALAAQPALPAEFLDATLARLAGARESAALALEQGEPLITPGGVETTVFQRLVQSHVKRGESRATHRIVTRVFPPDDSWSSEIPEAFLSEVSAGVVPPPEVVANAVLSAELEGMIITDLARLTLAVLFAVALYLIFYFRSVANAGLAMLPICFAVLCLLGAASLLDIHFNYLNVIAIPMVVGIGVDSGIHLMSRFYENNQHNLKIAVERTGRAIVITGLTTMFGFGSLSVASFKGIREIGLLAIVGVFSTLFAALLMLPAALRMRDPRYRYSGGPGDEIG